MSGFDAGDGKLAALGGLIGFGLLIGGAVSRNAGLLIAGTVLTALGAGVAVYDLVSLLREADSQGLVGIGSGVYVCIAGGLTALVCGIVAAAST